MNCTLCDSLLIRKKDACYYECDTCFALVKDQIYYLSDQEEKARYLTHNNDVNDIRFQKFTSPITNYVLENYSQYDKGLDFGSGTGPVITKILKDNNYDIVPFDPFFANTKEVLHDKYDYILSCEVFEHFYKPGLEMEKLSAILKPEGKLIIMTLLYDDSIDFSKWFYKNDPTHVFIYKKETIEYLSLTYGYEIEVLSNRFIVLKKLSNT